MELFIILLCKTSIIKLLQSINYKIKDVLREKNLNLKSKNNKI